MVPSGYYGGNSFAIGNSAGKYIQASRAIAIGDNAGITGQGPNAIAIGVNAGSAGASGYNIGQAPNSICIGTNAGIAADRSIIPAQNSVSIGINSQIPGFNSVAVGAGSRGGANSGDNFSGYGSAFGFAAGANDRGSAVGAFASANGQYSTAIGHDSQTQVDGVVIFGGSGGVAVGTGSRSYGNGLALGRAARAYDGQITLNSAYAYLDPPTTTPGFYVNSIRLITTRTGPSDGDGSILTYTSNKEIVRCKDLVIGQADDTLGSFGFVRLGNSSDGGSLFVGVRSGSGNPQILWIARFLDFATAVGAIINLNGSYSQTSDIRLKENINLLPDALEKVCQLQPKTFNFKSDPNKKLTTGFIAQDVELILPDIVDTYDDKGTETKTLHIAGIVPYLVSAVKSLNSKVTRLESELAEMKQTLALLVSRTAPQSS
jgi:hypothetical protein